MSRRDHQLPPIIPTDLSAEQALAIFEMLDSLRDQVYDRYGPDIQHALREQQRRARHDPVPLDDPPF